jgi:hypothetical protein
MKHHTSDTPFAAETTTAAHQRVAFRMCRQRRTETLAEMCERVSVRFPPDRFSVLLIPQGI